MARRLSWMIGIAVVVLGGAAYWVWGRAKTEEPLHFVTRKVRRGTIAAKVTATGTLSALVTVQVGSQVSGRLSEIYVDYNSPVKKNQVIARLDPRLFEAAVAQTQANLAAAQGSLAKAKVEAVGAERQLERAKTLKANGLLGQSDYETAETAALSARAQVQVAEGSLAQARASYGQAKVNLQYATIVSPINGVVISKSVDVGQTVAASFQAPVLFTIAEDLRKMQVDTFVAEADVGKLEPGMVATFTVDAYPGDKFRGKVRQIRSAPQTVQNVVTYDAVIDVDNSDLRLRPGMTANVTLIYARKDNVLTVANAALRFRAPPELEARAHGAGAGKTTKPQHLTRTKAGARQDQRVLWVLRGKNPVPLTIRTGLTDGTTSEVTDGALREGDLVITQVAAEDGRAPGGAGGSPGSGGGSGKNPFKRAM